MKNILRVCLLFVMLPFVVEAGCGERFKLKEFAGEWILSSSSVGGVGVNSGPGMASAILRHVTLDKDGNGTENNGSFVFYLADGTLVKYLGVNAETVILEITDEVYGAGTLTIIDNTSFHGTTVYNFIANRNKQGKIKKLSLILVETFGNPVVVTGVLERQRK